MSRFAWALTLALIAGSQAWADLVHLKNGSTLSGTIVSETEEELVLRTPDGRVTLPRHVIERVERQTRGETLLALARERAKAGAYEEAERLYEQAAADPDPALAARAREELAAFQQRRARSKGYREPPRTPWPLPAGVTGKPVEGESLQEQFDRARRAVEREDGLRALRLLEPLLQSKPDDLVLRYLVGRSLELSGRGAEARERYLSVLDERLPGRDRPAPLLGELCRRKLAGEKLGFASPGVGVDWRRVETEHFAIYHALAAPPAGLEKEVEDAYQDVLEAFEIKRREVFIAGKLQVLMLADRAAWEEARGLRLPGSPHAVALPAPDGILRMVLAYPDGGRLAGGLHHEVAHAVADDVYPGLPAWAAEGCASTLEPPAARAALRSLAARSEGHLLPLADLIAGAPAPADGRPRERWLAQAAVLFEALAERLGPRPALKLCQRLARDGVGALKAGGLTLQDLDKAFWDKARQGG